MRRLEATGQAVKEKETKIHLHPMEVPYPGIPSLQEIHATRYFFFFIIALPLFAHHDFFHIAIV